MLVAILTILFLGGGLENAVLDYAKLTRASLEDVVTDDIRRAEARDTLKEIEKLTKGYAKSNRKTFETLLSELTDEGADSVAVDSLWTEYSHTVDAYNQEMIDLRFKLIDSLSREEWEALFGAADQ